MARRTASIFLLESEHFKVNDEQNGFTNISRYFVKAILYIIIFLLQLIKKILKSFSSTKNTLENII